MIYFHSDSGGEAQRTIVTETRGPLAGQPWSAVASANALQSMSVLPHVQDERP